MATGMAGVVRPSQDPTTAALASTSAAPPYSKEGSCLGDLLHFREQSSLQFLSN